jgi:nitrite reductase/ring-hydroxylating ferredoxin subunit
MIAQISYKIPDGMRGPYGLHEVHGLTVLDLLRRRGAMYLGPAYGSKAFTFATKAFPEVCYYTNGQGEVWGHANACSHNKFPLIANSQLDTRLWKSPQEKIVCPFHSLSFDLTTGQCQGMASATLPLGFGDDVLRLTSQDLVVIHGFVFRLGDEDPEGAKASLMSGFSLVEELFPEIFTIDGHNDRITGDKFEATSEYQRADALTGLVNYLDILHVPSIHAESLGRVCAINGYRSCHNEHVIVQWMPLAEAFRSDVNSSYSSGFWRSLSEESLLRCPSTDGALGAVWVMFRQTGLMLEWYPGVIVISQCLPGWDGVIDHETDPRLSTFYHHFYYEDFANELLIEGHQDVFAMTGHEDEEHCSGTSATIFREIAKGNGGQQFGFTCGTYEDHATMFYRDMARNLVGV